MTSLMIKEDSSFDRTFVTAYLGDQCFALPVLQVKDVLTDASIATIPRAGDDIAGLINLRGRIVTVLDLWYCLGKPTLSCALRPSLLVMKATLETADACALLVDKVGEVMSVEPHQIKPIPEHLPAQWQQMANGVIVSGEEMIVVIDAAAILRMNEGHEIAA